MAITQIALPIDLILEATVRSSILSELEEKGTINLKVGIDIQLFPNRYNIIILNDASGELPPLECQCNGFYDPDTRQRAAGSVAIVRLTTTIVEPPEDVIQNLMGGQDPGFF